MLFNSLHFAVFFPVVTGLYFVLPHRFRWGLLLAASCYFYMVFIPVYILILGGTIVVDYCAGILIERNTGRRRRFYLVISIVANVGILAVFKYYNFAIDNLNRVLSLAGTQTSLPGLPLLLPIGLSFHTFQAMSYTIEVYRGNQAATRHFGIYALYVMFYPQLVAGPIERPQHLLHQFDEVHTYDYSRVVNGLKLMAWGLFKKVVLADRLALLVAPAYDTPTVYAGIPLVLATVCFAFQIYCDFSGYSDIAIGSAEVMGFRLMRNFQNPYGATSIAEFWRRWHISLSTWLRDYVYWPLRAAVSHRLERSGRFVARRAIVTYAVAAMSTMLLSGLWHGAGWTFVVWGGLNGVYLIVDYAMSHWGGNAATSSGSAAWALPRICLTFGLTCLGWVFFRASSLREALDLLGYMVSGMPSDLSAMLAGSVSLDHLLLGKPFSVGVVAVGVVTMLWLEAFDRRHDVRRTLAAATPALRWSAYYLLAMAIVIFGQFDSSSPFIYFAF
jgi:alginate O-acetyltransferase complex protein AlgI